MNILYLSKDMSGYAGAFYQQDIMDELARHHTVSFYGPGFPEYDIRHKLLDVLSFMEHKPDIIFAGHSWLIDNPRIEDIRLCPNIDLASTTIPTVLFLNKEYVNLSKKLQYARNQKFSLILTHHHDTDRYMSETGIPTYFIPFAVNMRRFVHRPAIPQSVDLFFSGILQNPSAPDTHDDMRIRAQKHLFYSIRQVYTSQRPSTKPLNIYWHTQAISWIDRYINRIIHGREKLSDEKYVRLLNRSKMCLNSLSPMCLVGTRYFESMAMKALVLSPESTHLHSLFKPNKHYVPFKDDLSDLIEKAKYFAAHDDQRKRITEQAFQHVQMNHTWEHRIEHVTKLIEDL